MSTPHDDFIHLPIETVIFLFTDIQGSTRLWEQHPDAMRTALARHDALLRSSIEANEGHIFKTAGDSFHAAFASVEPALAAVLAAQTALHAEAWPLPEGLSLQVRMAVHKGEAERRGGDYFGAALSRTARLLSAAHGGQTLLSETLAHLLAGQAPAGLSLRSLGQHRLKDLTQPQEIFQLTHPDLPDSFPPLRSLESFTHNLPSQLSSFIGREKEIGAARRMLTRTRLLTLTGTGGAGKTRLALQVAAEVIEDFPDGVWLVELAPLSDPKLLPQAVAAVLGVGEEGGDRMLVETLTDALRPKSLLLLWDNCEHLVDACAHLAESLLRACPGLRLLATTREALEISGEAVLSISSLSLPPDARTATAEALAGCDSVRLFVDRATAAQPMFHLSEDNVAAVAQVCTRLDGIPLLLELAAARVCVLTPEQIAERLDDRFRLLSGGSRTALPRQQTLRALIDWSYDPLPPAEKALLRRLSVFAGGWPLEGAESVCAEDKKDQGKKDEGKKDEGELEKWEILDLLARLVAKSLVVAETPQEGRVRYRLHESLRSYACERLTEAGEAAILATRHRDWFLGLAEEARMNLTGPAQVAWLHRLEKDHDNLRLALRHCQETDPIAGMRLARALAVFWRIRGYLSEGCYWLGAFLSATPDAPETLRANAFNSLGNLNWSCGDFAAARESYETCLTIKRALGDREGVATALNNIALVVSDQGDLEKARRMYEESLGIYRVLNRRGSIASVLVNLSTVNMGLGENAAARPLLEEALTLFNRDNNFWAMALAQDNLGNVCGKLNDFAAARSYLHQGIRLLLELKDTAASAAILSTAAFVCVMQEKDEEAARLFGASEALRQSLNLSLPPSEQEEHRLYSQTLEERLGTEAIERTRRLGHSMDWQEAMEYAMGLTQRPMA